MAADHSGHLLCRAPRTNDPYIRPAYRPGGPVLSVTPGLEAADSIGRRDPWQSPGHAATGSFRVPWPRLSGEPVWGTFALLNRWWARPPSGAKDPVPRSAAHTRRPLMPDPGCSGPVQSGDCPLIASAQRRSAAAADPAAVVTAAGLEPALTSPLMPCSSCYTTPSCYRAACPKLPGPSLRLSPSFRLSPVLSGQPAISMPCDPREMICRRGRCRHRPTLVSLAACPICQKGGNYGGAWHVAPWWIAPESNRVNHGVNHGDGFLIGCANLRTVPVIDALIDGSLTPRSI